MPPVRLRRRGDRRRQRADRAGWPTTPVRRFPPLECFDKRSCGFPPPSAGFSSRSGVYTERHFPPRHRRRFSPVETGGFLLRKDGGGDQGHPSIRRRRRRFTVQHPVQRSGGNAPSATDAAAKAWDAAAPSRRGLHGYTDKQRRLPGGKIGSFNHRQFTACCGDGRAFLSSVDGFIVLRKPSALCFFALGSSRPENPSPRFKDRLAFPCQGISGPFSFRAAVVAWFAHEGVAHAVGQVGSRPHQPRPYRRPTRRVVAAVATILTLGVR